MAKVVKVAWASRHSEKIMAIVPAGLDLRILDLALSEYKCVDDDQACLSDAERKALDDLHDIVLAMKKA